MDSRLDTRRILFVDDEPLLLDNYRELLTEHEVHTARSGHEALEMLRTAGPFAVVISDYHMPGMDGVEFLSRTRGASPHTVRMLLTGYADTQAAIRAVNEGAIYRFLTKPATYEDLLQAVEAGLSQYRIAAAERDMMERTLAGAVQVLTEILSLVSPAAFGRASRIRRAMGHMAAAMGLEHPWRYEIAGLLSQLGCIALAPEMLGKVWAGQPLTPEEQAIVEHHPAVGRALLEKIPRLESVARMIARQHLRAGETAAGPDGAPEEAAIVLGGEMLRTALALDQYLAQGYSIPTALGSLRRQADRYPVRLLTALENLVMEGPPRVLAVRVHELDTSMVLDQDVYARNGMLLVTRDHEVTVPVILRLRGFSKGAGVVEPIRVRIPGAAGAAGALEAA